MPLRVEPRRDRKLHRLVKAAPVQEVRRGAVVFAGGDAAAEVVLVDRGHLRLVGPEGRTVALAGPGELAGEEALVDGARRRWSAVAGEATRLRRLDGRRVAGVLRSSSATFGAFTDALLEDLRLLRRIATGAGGLPAEQRLAHVLLDLVRRAGEPVGQGSARRIPLRLTHRTLGDLSGAHRSTVTTLLNDWLYRDLLAMQGRTLVVVCPGELLPGGGSD